MKHLDFFELFMVLQYLHVQLSVGLIGGFGVGGFCIGAFSIGLHVFLLVRIQVGQSFSESMNFFPMRQFLI